LPIEYTKYLWGWPYRFLGEVNDVEPRYYLFVNTKEDLVRILGLPLDGIVTEHTELLGDIIKKYETSNE
jgi:hypothetical protein